MSRPIGMATPTVEELEAEIERLTDDVAAMGNECIKLRLEIERLRAALYEDVKRRYSRGLF